MAFRSDRARFEPEPARRQRLPAGRSYLRHRHARGYLSIVLSGGFEESGDFGRRTVRAGDVLIRPRFSSHANGMMKNSEVLNLTLPPNVIIDIHHGLLNDPDMVVRASERDSHRALAVFLEYFVPVRPRSADWPDVLADRIARDPTTRLAEWAAANGLHIGSLSRGFRELYGITPARYRREQRARLGWNRLVQSDEAPSAIAYDLGFSDQPHFCREIRILTGKSPAHWRALKKFKTWP